jgi:hypothetical protein
MRDNEYIDYEVLFYRCEVCGKILHIGDTCSCIFRYYDEYENLKEEGENGTDRYGLLKGTVR